MHKLSIMQLTQRYSLRSDLDHEELISKIVIQITLPSPNLSYNRYITDTHLDTMIPALVICLIYLVFAKVA